jgi:hypothetical protein
MKRKVSPRSASNPQQEEGVIKKMHPKIWQHCRQSEKGMKEKGTPSRHARAGPIPFQASFLLEGINGYRVPRNLDVQVKI